MKRFTLPDDLMEEAYAVQDDYPGLSAEEVAIELLKQSIEAEKREIEEAREQAIERLKSLSVDALQFVSKPIEWAYNYTDGHDEVSDEDGMRYSLVTCAIRDSQEHVDRIANLHFVLSRAERDRRVNA